MLLATGIPISKRIFDLLITITGLVFLSPLFLILAVFVWYFHGRPILFYQERGGYQGKTFRIIKFRTMNESHDSSGKPLSDTQRLTRFGKFLRSSSLDELPELLNILKGDMSLVGPRPLFAHYLDRYSKDQKRRHDVLPGLTGWAQVNGRNALTWEEKFSLDVWYVDNWSLSLDIKILVMTFVKVLRREGINEPGVSTSREFQPDNPNNQIDNVENPKEHNS
jgi:sugar transferase EpsL